PFAAPHPVRELGHGVEDGVDLGHDVLAVHDDRRATRSAQGDVQDGPIFGHVDLVAPEHGVDALPEATLRGQSTEQRDGLVGDPILGVVEIDPGRLRGEALTTAWVLGEQRAEVTLRDLLLVILERLPRLARGQRQDSHHRLLPYFRRGRSIVRLLPQAETSGEGIYVVAGAAARRQRLELVNVAAPEDDVLWLERGDEASDDVLDVVAPLSEPMRLQPVQSDVLLERAVPVRQVAELHRLDNALDDHGGAQAGAEPEEEHLAVAVTAEPLHRRIVDDLDGTPKCSPIVESDP